ncbi:hypothetical protein Tco_1317678 [Tanacetum coccineum]
MGGVDVDPVRDKALNLCGGQVIIEFRERMYWGLVLGAWLMGGYGKVLVGVREGRMAIGAGYTALGAHASGC